MTQVAPLDGSGGRFQNILSPEEQAKIEARTKAAAKNGKVAKGGGDGANRKTEFVNVTVIDAIPGYVTVPTDYTESMIEALRRPYAVAVDQTALKRLGVKKGDNALYNGKTINIAVVTTGYPQHHPAHPGDVARHPADAGRGRHRPAGGPADGRDPRPGPRRDRRGAVEQEGRRQVPRLDPPGAGRRQSGAMLDDQIIGIMLGFSAFLGLLIGVAITWQTLRGAIMANIKEFASLRALGVSMGDLRNVVMELSFWVGIVGVVAAGVLTWLVTLLASASGVPMSFPPMLVGIVAVFLIIIAMLSGFLSLGILKNSQPADLLR